MAAAHDDDHLHAEFAHFANLFGHALDSFGVDADAGFAAERFAAEFEENPGKLGALGFAHRKNRW